MNKVEQALTRTTDTRDIYIGRGVVSRTGEMFKKLFPEKKAVIVADENTWRVAGAQVEQSLREAGVEQHAPHIFRDPELYAHWRYVEQLEEVLSATDAIAVAVGSGVINDLTKLVSHRCSRHYMCVGTAVSMDGYTAYGASITLDGNKQTFDCPAPYGFIFDPTIAAEAPKELAASGYADLIAKIPAGADWMISDAIGAEAIDPFSWDLVQNGLRESLSAPDAVFAGDVDMTEALGEGLIMSGFAMQAMQSSRPASGAEHQFSHCWDMENLCFEGKHVSHGFKVGIGTLISTAAIELLLKEPLEELDIDRAVANWKPWDDVEQDILRIFAGKPGHTARAIKETRDKYVDSEGLRRQLTLLKDKWPQLREKIRRQIIPFEEVYADLKAVGAPYEPEMIGVTRERLRDTFGYIPYMRSRITSVDIIFRCGLMEKFTELLFGRGGLWQV